MTRKKIYKAPNYSILEGYTRELCKTMADVHNDPSYSDAQFINSFTNFVKVAINVEVKQRNQQDTQK